MCSSPYASARFSRMRSTRGSTRTAGDETFAKGPSKAHQSRSRTVNAHAKASLGYTNNACLAGAVSCTDMRASRS